jgi:hypothetical protein
VAVRLVTYAEDPPLVDRFPNDGIWPEFLYHDSVTNRYWSRLYSDHGEFQFVLHDDEEDRFVGQGNTIPTTWDGTAAGLADGVDGVLEERFGLENPPAPNALCALVAIVPAAERGSGWSRRVLEGMRDLAAQNGLGVLIAPVRPTHKTLYPLIPLERYARWARPDGLPFDPWMRVHHRLGATILGIAARSLVVTGTVAEEWTGLSFPGSGDYVVPEALAPVQVDRERDIGEYVEPNVWMRHPVPTRG